MTHLKYFTLARLKALCAFLGATLTFALSVTTLPSWTVAAAAILTFVSVYNVPNVGYKPRRALVENDQPALFG
jgi:hypothetical protein